MVRPFRRLSLVLALAGALLAPAARADAPHTVLTIGLSQFPSNFSPLIENMVAKSYVLGMALRPFTVYDSHWRLVCMLCTRLPTLENGLAVKETGPDGRPGVAITYTIQPKATWGDGVPVTTADVKFTWEVGRDPRTGIADAEMFRRIRAIDIKDDKTFTLHVSRLTFDDNAINDFQLLPAHLETRAFTDPAQYRTRSLYDTDTTNPGLYFGPYRITQVVRGQYVVLEPNPTWWGRKPAFARIVVRSIDSTPALEAALLSGGVDMIAGEVGFTLDAALAFQTRHRPEWRVIYKPGLSYEHISLNLDNPILADRRVRQALLLALDRETMMHQIFQDHQRVADGPVNPLDWCYDPKVKHYAYDPAAAARLLDDAGWKTGPDGLRRNARGQPLAFEIMTTAGLRNREVMEMVVRQEWRRLGIAVSIRNQPARVFFSQSVLRHAFPGAAMFAWISAPESVPRAMLASDMVPGPDNNFAGENVTGYSNPRMDALLNAIEVELDKNKRGALWRQLQALYAEDLPALPLTFRSDPFVLPAWLDGVEPTGDQYPTTLWVENWFVKQVK